MFYAYCEKYILKSHASFQLLENRGPRSSVPSSWRAGLGIVRVMSRFELFVLKKVKEKRGREKKQRRIFKCQLSRSREGWRMTVRL